MAISPEMAAKLQHWSRTVYRQVNSRAVSQDAWDRAAKVQSNLSDLLKDPTATDEQAATAIDDVREIIMAGGLE